MKKYVLYIFMAILCGVLFFLTRDTSSEADVFYGFSINKERELNFDYDVKVMELLVNSGQYVKKGDPLIRVIRTSNPLKFQNIENEISLLEIKYDSKKKDINDKISALVKEREGKLIDFQSKEFELLSEIKQHEILLEVIDAENHLADSTRKTATQLKLDAQRKQKEHILKALDKEISSQRALFTHLKEEHDQHIKKLIDEKDFFMNQEKDHVMKAPDDALVGFINCSPGENYSSFSKLISIYDPHPKLVKAYILENLLTTIEIGDEVSVASTLNPSSTCNGTITGFGTKIMEIPNRLKKIPELKVYGRQVLISISGDNELLQNEKVVVKLKASASSM